MAEEILADFFDCMGEYPTVSGYLRCLITTNPVRICTTIPNSSFLIRN